VTKRQLSCIKQAFLYPRMELGLCLVMVVSICGLVVLDTPNLNSPNRYYTKKAAQKFFLRDEMGKVKNFSTAFDFLGNISQKMYYSQFPIPYKPLSVARMAMFHSNIEQECYNRTLLNDNSKESTLLMKFGLTCNRVFDEADNETITESLFTVLKTFEDYEEICREFNCSTLNKTQTNIPDFEGYYQYYGHVGHIIDFPNNKTEMLKILNFINASSDIMISLRALVLKLTYFNIQDRNILTVKYILETTGDSVIRSKVVIDMVETEVRSLILVYFLLGVLIICCSLYSLRLIFEIQLGITKLVTGLFEVIYIALLIVLVFSYLIFFSLIPENIEHVEYPMLKFVAYDMLIGQKKGIKVIMYWVLFLTPFKVFQVLVHFSPAKPMKELLNIYARMYPGIVWFLLNYFGFFYVCQALGFNIMFGQYINLCQTMVEAFNTILSTEISKDREYKEIIENYELPVTQISAVFIEYFYLLVISFFIAELGYLFKKSIHFEKANLVSPKQLQL